MSNDELKRLRAEIAKKHKAVGNKIQRTAKVTGAKVAGTQFDPRRKEGTENRMRNTANMREYLAQLNDFMGRGNQFVAGQEGAPIPRSTFNIYKKTEAAVEKIRQERDAVMGGIQQPDGFTIRDFQTALPKAGGSTKYGPYRKFDREASDFKDFEAAKKLTADMMRRADSDYVASEIASGREVVEKVLTHLSANKLSESVDELTDDQFDLIWFGTTFAAKLFMYYDLEKEREDANYKEKNQDKVIDNQFSGLPALIKWAKEQNPGE